MMAHSAFLCGDKLTFLFILFGDERKGLKLLCLDLNGEKSLEIERKLSQGVMTGPPA